MPPKNSKPRLMSRKRSRPLGRKMRFIGSDKQPTKPVPNTSRIPWFIESEPTTRKLTGQRNQKTLVTIPPFRKTGFH